MEVLVLLSGVADPKWPLPSTVTPESLGTHRKSHPCLSPFDEAALEAALKFRDADDATRITALVAAGSAQDPLLRAVASYRLDRVAAMTGCEAVWDTARWAAVVGGMLAAHGLIPDAILMGREFGDEDDGGCGPALAEGLKASYVSQVLSVSASQGVLRVTRQAGSAQAVVSASPPIVLGVTNDARNKLRHPLMKNVMAAKRMSFDTLGCGDASTARVELLGVKASTPPARKAACRMLEGDARQQAVALLALLKERDWA